VTVSGRVYADLSGGLIRGCGSHGSGVAAMAQLSKCKASKCLNIKKKLQIYCENSQHYSAYTNGKG